MNSGATVSGLDSNMKELFNNFIKASTTKVYYNTIIESSEQDGNYSGEFDQEFSKYYDIGYYTEMPQIMLDLDQAEPSKQRSTVIQTSKDSFDIQVSFEPPGNQFDSSGNLVPKEVLSATFNISLSNYPNIVNIINGNVFKGDTTKGNNELSLLKKYLASNFEKKIMEFVGEGTLKEITNENILEIKEALQDITDANGNMEPNPENIIMRVLNDLSALNTKVANKKGLSIPKNLEPGYCKIS
jgi:hypothetical protein